MASAMLAPQGPDASTMTSMRSRIAARKEAFKKDKEANLDIGHGLAIAFVVIGAVIAAVIVAALAPVYIRSVANASKAVSTADFGNPTVNLLTSPMGLLVGVAGLGAIVLLIVGSISLRAGS